MSIEPPHSQQQTTTTTTITSAASSDASSSSSSHDPDSDLKYYGKVLMHGFLVKQGAIMKNWKRRYFVLYERADAEDTVKKPPQLLYYKKKTDKQPIACINLNDLSLVYKTPQEAIPKDKDLRFMFELDPRNHSNNNHNNNNNAFASFEGGGGGSDNNNNNSSSSSSSRIYKLVASSEKERDVWIRKLRKAISPPRKLSVYQRNGSYPVYLEEAYVYLRTTPRQKVKVGQKTVAIRIKKGTQVSLQLRFHVRQKLHNCTLVEKYYPETGEVESDLPFALLEPRTTPYDIKLQYITINDDPGTKTRARVKLIDAEKQMLFELNYVYEIDEE